MEKKLEVELETIVMPAANLLDPAAISRMLEIKCARDTGVFSQHDFGEVWWRKARLNLVVHIRDVYLVDGSTHLTWSCFFEDMWRILNSPRFFFHRKAFDANNIAMHVLECLAILDAVWIQDMCYNKFIFRDMPLTTDLKYIDLGQMSEAARPKLQLMLLNATRHAVDPLSLGVFAKFGPVFAQQSYANLASGLVIAEEFVSRATDACCLALQHDVRFGWGNYMQGYRGSDPRMKICRVVKWLPAGSPRNRCIERLACALDFNTVPGQDRHVLPKAVLRRLSPRDLSRVAKVFLNSRRRIRQVQLENGRLSSCRQAWIAAVLI
jgi:hypothetical protein